jgi:hypothetical protein
MQIIGQQREELKQPIEEDFKPTTNDSADDQVKLSSSCPTTITHSPIFAIDEFFYNNPDSPDQPLPYHVLEQSPCYPTTGVNNDYKIKSITSHKKKL